jgi:hypothetical protein
MRTLTRWEPFRGATALQEQVNRLFNDVFERKSEESSLTAWRLRWISMKPSTNW